MRYGYLIFIYGVCITYLKIRTRMISPEFRDCCWSEYPKFKLYDCWPNKDTVISMDRNCNQYYLKVWKCPLTAQKNGICRPFAACAEARWSLCHHSSIGQWPVLSPNQDRPMSGRWKNGQNGSQSGWFLFAYTFWTFLSWSWTEEWGGQDQERMRQATNHILASRWPSELRNPHATILWPTHHKANALRVAATFGCSAMAAMWLYSRSQYIE